MSRRPKDDDNDVDLLRRWQAGERAAAELLIRRHGPALARFFRNKVFNDGEDLVQETFTRLLTKGEAYTAAASVRTYLFSIARNIFLDHVRRRSRRQQVHFDLDSVLDLGASPSSIVSRSQECMLLAQALRKIPMNEQIIVELAYWEGCTMDEIAVILDIPPGTVRSRVGRARERLNRLLQADTPVADDESLDRWLEELRKLLTD